MPYDEQGEEIPLERFTAQAAAGLHTTLADMITFAKASFRDNPVLSNETITMMQTPVEATDGRYGLGYMKYKMGPVTMTGHAGSNDGWQAGFMFNADEHSGVIILTNGSNGKQLAMQVLKQWIGWKMNQ